MNNGVKPLKFSHTEVSFSNSFVSRTVAVGQSFFCIRLFWILITAKYNKNYSSYIAERLQNNTYTEPDWSSTYDDATYAICVNCVVYLCCLFLILGGQIS